MSYRLFAIFAAVGLVLTGSPAVFAQGGTSAGQAAKRKQEERKLTKPPKLVKEVKAKYTDEAIEAEVEGAVSLKIQIGKDGSVEKAQVVDGLGYGLDEAAVEAVKQFEFEPAEINGEPAAVTLTFKVRFSMPTLPATFRGTVIGAESSKPVSGVRVQIDYTGEEYDSKPSGQMTTGGEGNFSFENIPPGPYQVTLSAPEREDVTTTVELGNNETVEVDYTLSKAPIVVSGRVREAGTREKLAGVEVVLLEPRGDEVIKRYYTDQEGRFTVRGLVPGNYRFKIQTSGYESDAYVETVEPGKRLEVTYYLKAEYYDEFSVTTTARREKKTVDRDTIKLEEVRRIPGTGGDLVRSVQNLPGVARASFGSGQLVVRGSTPQSTRTFIEGDEIPVIYHFFGGPSVINAEMVESIDFYPGNYRAKYGRALAGIIDLQTRVPDSEEYGGFAEVDVIDATAQVEGPIGDDVSFSLSGRRSYIDLFLPAIVPEDTVNLSVAPKYYDYQGWLSWEVNDAHRLEWFVYGSNDRLEALFQEDEPQGDANFQVTGLDVNNGFHRGQMRWEYRPEGGEFRNDAMVSFGGNQLGFEAAQDLFFKLEFLQMQIRDDLRWEINETVQFNAGVDTQIGRADVGIRAPGFSGDNMSDPGSARNAQMPTVSETGYDVQREGEWIAQPAVYSELEVEPTDQIRMIPGVRVDYFSDIDEFAFSPRFNTRWDISEKVALKGGIGFFAQPPDPGQTDPDFGNPDLSYEKANQYSIGTEYRPVDFLEFDTTLFYRDLYDLVTTTNATSFNQNTGSTEAQIYDNSGLGRAYGLEMLIRHYPANKFFGWLAYTLSRSERFNPATDSWDAFQFDQTHNLTLLAGYNLPWNVDISARFRLSSGNPRTPIVGSVWNADSDGYSPVYGQANSERSPFFHQLDVRVDKQWVFNTWRLGVYLDVINAYNASNEEGKRYNYDYSESAPVRGLPIIPTLGVNGRF